MITKTTLGIRTALLVIAGLLLYGGFRDAAQAATTVSGSVSGIWDEGGSPYSVAGDVLVARGKSLAIHPNVRIAFQGPYVFQVDGTLQATGLKGNPIVFAAAVANAGWEGVLFNGSSPTSLMTHCEISGAINSGVRIKNCSPRLDYCTISKNSSPLSGGGILAEPGVAKLVISNCIIRDNTAPGFGGGLTLKGAAEVSNCTFTGNGARAGGGLYLELWSGSVTAIFRNCRVIGNASSYYGGGYYCSFNFSVSTVEFYNCIIASNTAVNSTGGIYTEGTGRAIVVNCTVANNGSVGLGMGSRSSAAVTNSIVFGNDNNGNQTWGSVSFAHCNVQGGIQAGPNNISVNPLLESGTLGLQAGSPCIDAGIPNPVFNDSCRPPSRGGERNDLGAYGGPYACRWLAPATIESPPLDQTMPEGASVAFSATVSGDPPLSYQWLFNGAPIGGATSSSYEVESVERSDAGRYSVLVSNPAGSATSVAALLTVLFPHAATATATVVNGFMVGVDLADGGYGYANAPKVRILGDEGSGAEAVAIVSNGIVTGVTVRSPGKGYVKTPVVVIAPPFIQQPKIGMAALSSIIFSNLLDGGAYQLEHFSGSTVSPIGAPFTAVGSTHVQLVPSAVAEDSYRLTVTPAPIQAKATAQVVNGFTVGITVTVAGTGYISAPEVTISGGGGSGATAVASELSGGGVRVITIVNPGSGYTSAPNITIALPPSTSLSPFRIEQVMDVHLEDLSPYDKYQLEFAHDPTGGWTELNLPVIPISSTWSGMIQLDGQSGFLRARYVP